MKTHYTILFFKILIFISASQIFAQAGCTDPLANNYNSSATINNGSCTYNLSNVSPTNSTTLNNNLDENSGLVLWNNKLWTHQDGGSSTEIFSSSVSDLSNFVALNIPGVTNVDWEDITQDDNYIYIGDFGNNANGNRTDLKVYRISKSSINQGAPVVDVINFTYPDQTDFTPQGANNTDFDCEAFIVSDSKIYLFTKEWLSGETTVYSMPKLPGTYSAINQGSFDVNGLITGATDFEDQQLVVLSGYSSTLQPFVYLLYDFAGNNFFTGNKRKVGLNLPFHQVEAIATNNGIDYFVSNEYISNSGVTIQPQIHNLDLTNFLIGYLNYITSGNSMNFNDPTAWLGGVVPPSGSDITIAHNLNINQDYTAGSIDIEANVTLTTNSTFTLGSQDITLQSDANLTLAPGAILNVSGNIINDGLIYFESDGPNGPSQFDVFNGTISGTGEVTTERFIPAKRIFRFHSSRVNTSTSINANWQEGATTASANPNPNPGYGVHITGGSLADGFDQNASGNPSIFTFDNTFVPSGTQTQNDAYLPLPNTNVNTLSAGQPKLILNRGDRSINLLNNMSPPTDTRLRATGTLHTGSFTFDVGNPIDYLNLNPDFELLSLVANPYQAVVDYNKVTRDDLTEYIYVWDVNLGGTNSRGGYVTVETPSVAGTVNAPKPGLSEANEFLAPGMPFFVQNLESGFAGITAPFSPTLTFDEVDKSTDQSATNVFNTYPNFYINSRVYKTIDQQNGNRESDALGLRFSSNYTTPGSSEDASKLFNNRVSYAVDNNGLRAIDKRGVPNIGDEIDLFMLFTQPEATSYSLTYSIENKPVGLGVFLKDDYLNTQTEITDNFVYDFTINTTIPGTIATDRFSLLFDSSIGFEDNTFGSDFVLYPNPTSNGQFNIKTPNLSGEVNVEITSLLGQKVYTQKLSVAGNQVDITPQNLSSGMYVVKLTQGNQSYNSKLIVE